MCFENIDFVLTLAVTFDWFVEEIKSEEKLVYTHIDLYIHKILKCLW